ncbi:MAG: prenyltransferase/squalene oxidase repeat-containing protein, partial [Promethearchaeota archaeon]
LVTRRVIDAYLSVNMTVPDADLITNWVKACWHDSKFIDDYSDGFFTVIDDDHPVLSTPYSPLVATAHAIAILSALDNNSLQQYANNVTEFTLSCLVDLGSGKAGFSGDTGDTVVTIENTWAGIEILYKLNRLSVIEKNFIVSFILEMMSPNGLFDNHRPSIKTPQFELISHSTSVTLMAIQSLDMLDAVSNLPPDYPDKLLSFYNSSEAAFLLNEYYIYIKTVASADALRIFEITGYPDGFETNEVPRIIDYLGATQGLDGGWPSTTRQSITEAQYSAWILTAVSRANPSYSSSRINQSRVFDMLESCKIKSCNQAGYSPMPPTQVSVSAIKEILEVAMMMDVLGNINPTKLLEYVAASSTQFPNFGIQHLPSVMDYRLLTDQGVQVEYAKTEIKLMLNSGFSPQDIDSIAQSINNSQITFEIQGCEGFHAIQCLDVFVKAPSLKFRFASPENSLAVIRILNKLSFMNIGSYQEFFDESMLVDKIKSCYRETPTEAWFTRPYPISFQTKNNHIDSGWLAETRVFLELLNEGNWLANLSASSTINTTKLEVTIEDSKLMSITDIDNYLACMTILNATIPAEKEDEILSIVFANQDNQTGWFARDEMPSLPETLKAFKILGRFCGLRVKLEPVQVYNNDTVVVFAGSKMASNIQIINYLTGSIPDFEIQFSFKPVNSTAALLSIHNNDNFTLSFDIPMSEDILGNATLIVESITKTRNLRVEIPIEIRSVLKIVPLGNPIVFTTNSRQPLQTTIQLYIVNPFNTSIGSEVFHDATITATGVNVDGVYNFVFINASGHAKYVAILDVDPVDENSTFIMTAAKPWCNDTYTVLIIQCLNNNESAKTIIIPTAMVMIGSGIVATTIIHGKRVKKIKLTKNAIKRRS